MGLTRGVLPVETTPLWHTMSRQMTRMQGLEIKQRAYLVRVSSVRCNRRKFGDLRNVDDIPKTLKTTIDFVTCRARINGICVSHQRRVYLFHFLEELAQSNASLASNIETSSSSSFNIGKSSSSLRSLRVRLFARRGMRTRFYSRCCRCNSR
jgi:hypothetical protein